MRHKNSQRRMPTDGHVVFITTVTCERYPYFRDQTLSELFVLDLYFAAELKEIELYGYAVLPDHVHLLFRPSEEINYSEVVGSIKRNVARDVNCLFTGKPFIRNLHAGDDSNRRLRGNFDMMERKPNQVSFAVFEHHFHELEILRKRFEASGRHWIPSFRWQKSFHDHIIRNEKDFYKHLNYIWGNAVKHGLAKEPEDWKWVWILGLHPPAQ